MPYGTVFIRPASGGGIFSLGPSETSLLDIVCIAFQNSVHHPASTIPRVRLLPYTVDPPPTAYTSLRFHDTQSPLVVRPENACPNHRVVCISLNRIPTLPTKDLFIVAVFWWRVNVLLRLVLARLLVIANYTGVRVVTVFC